MKFLTNDLVARCGRKLGFDFNGSFDGLGCDRCLDLTLGQCPVVVIIEPVLLVIKRVRRQCKKLVGIIELSVVLVEIESHTS